ncbi:hypothetical protein K461DRAFT_281136 [Myriangium duriaei CBS 260.36]|uniref:Uncharacterized protein n=1 Tax=Myriangium duriaei CBS 260.36 TaxID=1168546 RepID=A0A9P4ITV7_9PEZI|nr:hypothetical protein K461DRAFT_281136 [Myriangium duriaei CBS 260.36]
MRPACSRPAATLLLDAAAAAASTKPQQTQLSRGQHHASITTPEQVHVQHKGWLAQHRPSAEHLKTLFFPNHFTLTHIYLPDT